MKFFIQFTTLNYKIRHAAAVELSKIYPGSTFAGTVSSIENVAEKYLLEQREIHYEFLFDQSQIVNDALKVPADVQLLKNFEETLPEKSLWRFFAMDRNWGYPFLKGVLLPNVYIQRISTQDNILRVASGIIRYYTDMIAQYRPDVFIPAAGQNSMSCPIIDQICQNSGILYVMPEIIRTQNYITMTDNRQCTFPQVNDTYRKLMNGTLTLDLSVGEKMYHQIISDVNNTQYFNVSKIDHLASKFPWLRFIKKSLRSVCSQMIRWQKEKPLRQDLSTIFRQPNDLKSFLYNLYYVVTREYRRMQLMSAKFYTPFDPKQKYIYFPLHCSNEYSTQVQGTMWTAQLPVIEALAKSIPFDWKLVIKEHPGMLIWRVRPASFYKEIKQYSNVALIPTNTNSNTVIQHAQMIATIVGTTGWEAVLREKPVIAFEENMFDVLELSRVCTDFKELSVAIAEESKRIKEISFEERKKRLIYLLTAIAKHSVWVEDPYKVTGDNPCEVEESFEIGSKIAHAMKEFIEYKQNTHREKISDLYLV